MNGTSEDVSFTVEHPTVGNLVIAPDRPWDGGYAGGGTVLKWPTKPGGGTLHHMYYRCIPLHQDWCVAAGHMISKFIK